MDTLGYANMDFQLQEVAAFVVDAETKGQLEKSLSRFNFNKLEIFKGDVKDATRKFKKISSPELLIVDISRSDLPLTDLQNLANVCSPNVRVVVIGNQDNVGLYRNLLSQGVSEYLVKPLPIDLIYRVLEKIQLAGNVSVSPPKIGKSLGVYGVCGGVGSTSILRNLADLLSVEMHRRIMLIDLNLYRGDLGIQLGQVPNSGLSDLLGSPERMDGLFIERTAISIGSRLDLLNADESWENAINVSPVAVTELTEHLRKRYHFVLCDVMNNPLHSAFKILASMDVRILLLSPSLASLRNTKRILLNLEQEKMEGQTLIVLNHSRPTFKTDLTVKKIEQFIGCSVDFQIPYDGKNFANSAFYEIPLVRSRGKAGQQIRKLAERLVGQKKSESSRLFWKSITVRG
ncbi:MAG: hypothetical protein COB29_15925 [Sulfitobacter sp.]|nr:MAG: hypothetical protein COB29_15925 [Sulfitobacter sp.]